MSGALVKAGAALARWSEEQQNLIRQQVCPGATDAELSFFAQVCAHRDLDPFAGEITGIMRWNGKTRKEELKIQVTVEGLRTIAGRTGLYAGQDEPLWCGPDGEWRDVWLNEKTPPAAAKVAVHRSDWQAPAVGKAHYAEFVQLDKDGNPTPMWKKMPANQLAKCAERQALIRAFKREMKAAGVDVDDLAPQSRLVMEARNAGLDDDQRHALISEVTNGRIDSSKDIADDDERLAVRQAIARHPTAPEDDEPQDAEVVDEPGRVRRIIQAGPPGMGDSANYYDENGELLRRTDGEELYRRQVIQRVYDDREKFSEGERRMFDDYRTGKLGIPDGTLPKDYTTDQLAMLDHWLDNVIGEPF